jgi:hypothetical protein
MPAASALDDLLTSTRFRWIKANAEKHQQIPSHLLFNLHRLQYLHLLATQQHGPALHYMQAMFPTLGMQYYAGRLSCMAVPFSCASVPLPLCFHVSLSLYF